MVTSDTGAQSSSAAAHVRDSAAQAPRRDRRVGLTAVALLVLALAATAVIRAGEQSPAGGGSDLGDPALGDPDAPVVVVEYSDFGCPFCARHAREVKPAILEAYVETGVVRYVWRDLPLQGEDSYRAALAGRAAQEQGLFWEFHDTLFAAGDADLSAQRLRGVAALIGADVAAFDEAVSSEAHADLVDSGSAAARQLGLSGTPSFTVNGERVLGAQPYEVFEQLIERAAAEAAG